MKPIIDEHIKDIARGEQCHGNCDECLLEYSCKTYGAERKREYAIKRVIRSENAIYTK